MADGSEHPQRGRLVASSQGIDPQTGTYSVEASFPNPQKILLPGQFARVRALYQVLEDAVVVPRQAVSEIQGLFRVYTADAGGKVAVREVQLGPETGDDIVIESGLEAGTDVIVEGLQKVRPGMTVRPAQRAASLVAVQLPDAASLERTDRVTAAVEKILGETLGVQSVTAVAGYSLLTSTLSSNSASFFISLDDWADRPGAELHVNALIQQVNRRFAAEIPQAIVFAFGPPAPSCWPPSRPAMSSP